MITEDFAAAVAAVGLMLKIPVHNEKEYPHEQRNDERRVCACVSAEGGASIATGYSKF
jgi:hypothetical protein